MPLSKPVIYNEDDTVTELPIRWVICPTCDGHGKHSRHIGALTQSDRDEWHPDELADYMAGGYDRACEPCDGTGKVAVADERQMTKEQRKAYREQIKADREIEAEHAAERRIGA